MEAPAAMVAKLFPKGDSGSFSTERMTVTRSQDGGAGQQEGERLRRLELRARMAVEGVVSYNVCDDGEQDPKLRGGQGLVVKAYTIAAGSKKPSDYFALKQPLDPGRLRGHKREAQVYFNLDPNEHPHLAFLADVVGHEGTPLLVMEWADADLGRWLEQQQKKMWQRAQGNARMVSMLMQMSAGFGIQLARGLVCLHGLELILSTVSNPSFHGQLAITIGIRLCKLIYHCKSTWDSISQNIYLS